ncbi:MAG: hypothetical protein M3Q71_24475 [Chloroflexota bacterium]|nr:hypothetical protein [Chloroflexota bacterium]MDP9473778.1 hypothetical protein [Chloroflexota bacterium]
MWDELFNIGSLPAGVSITSGTGEIAADGVVYRRARAQGGTAEVAKDAICRHFPRQQISFDSPPN